MEFAIVSHHSRKVAAEKLAHFFEAELFIDYGNHGSAWNHRQALEWANTQDERVVIIEDDAIPTDRALNQLRLWLLRFPDQLISFYLGTSRPPQWQRIVTERMTESDTVGKDFITLPKLIHGVAYSVPKKDIPQILENMDMEGSADFSIGDAWRIAQPKEVVYTIYSLFEHEDGESIERHADGKLDRGIRKARRLFSPLVW